MCLGIPGLPDEECGELNRRQGEDNEFSIIFHNLYVSKFEGSGWAKRERCRKQL